MESPFSIKAKTLCRSLLSLPWCNLPLEDINVEPITTGRSNRLFICSRPSTGITTTSTATLTSNCDITEAYQQSSSSSTISASSKREQVDKHSKVIVRFYGSDFTGEGNQYKCVSDEEEIEILNILSSRGLSPSVLTSFPGGRIDEYIESTTLDPKRLDQIDILTLLGPKIAQYHVTSFKCEKTYDLIQIYRDNISKAMKILSNYDETSLADCSESILLLRRIKQFYIDQPINQLIDKIIKTKQRNVFAHMDLNYTNFLFLNDSNNLSPIKSSSDVMIIDVENSQNNYRGIDLGKFFSELCIGDNSGDLYHIPDSSIHLFIDSYLNEWKLICDPDQFDPAIDNHDHVVLEIQLGFLFVAVFEMTWNILHPNFGSNHLLNNTATRIDIFNHYSQQWSQIIQ